MFDGINKLADMTGVQFDAGMRDGPSTTNTNSKPGSAKLSKEENLLLGDQIQRDLGMKVPEGSIRKQIRAELEKRKNNNMAKL
tara:strand:- start:20 stop:268 length:249 start_codon:yes stop_codon:yes gene_type:complete